MQEWQIKAILEISLINLAILIPTCLSAGLYINRYNRRITRNESNQKKEELIVEDINKPNKGRTKKKNKRTH